MFDLPGVLRTNPEPYGYLTEAEIHRLLTTDPGGYLTFVKEALHEIALGEASIELPPKQIFGDEEGGGDFRVMPCTVRRGGRTTKTVKLVGTNMAQNIVPDQITVGKAFAIHPEENFVSHIFESCLLSSARTGLCAALATKLLTDSPENLTVVGAGRVGFYSALYVAAATPTLRRISFFDLDRGRAQGAAESFKKDYGDRLEVAASGGVELGDTDVLVLATTSSRALCSPADTNAALVISLGADTDSQSELARGWATEARTYVDMVDSARYGDLKRWLEEGLLTPEELIDLPCLLRDGPGDTSGRKVFISTGSALMDNLTIAYLLAQSDE